MSGLFLNKKVNTGRQMELDIAKAFSIIFMIFLHVLMVVGGFENTVSPTYNFIIGQVLGRPCAAPVFMFCMGVGIIYSRHSQWDSMIKRGVKLYLLGILVNIFEFILPNYAAGLF
ncbi:heparan-alpha-glucosaminide N-acetyltransferase domain-containing protein [Methanobrevibacter sp.]